MFKMTIKTHILIIFLALVGILALSLIFSQYYFHKKLALESTTKTFRLITKHISEHMENQSIARRKFLKITSKHSKLLEPITFNPIHPFFDASVQELQRDRTLNAIYFTDPKDNCYEVVNMQDKPHLTEAFEAPKLACWMVINIIGQEQQNTFLDKEFNIIKNEKAITDYDLQSRPWYRKAMNSSATIATLPYMFSNSHKIGITYAKKFNSEGSVLALDYTMNQLNKILAWQAFDENSEVFMVDSKGNKFASSAYENQHKTNQEKILNAELKQVILEQKIDQIIKYSEEKNNYFVMFTPLVSKDRYLGIKVNADVLLKPYKESMQYTLLIAFILLLLTIPIIFLSTHRIIKPIKALILENTKIKDRSFSKVNEITTNIVEFEALSDSQVSMSKSIEMHEMSQEELLDAVIKLIAEAIDTKSLHTGGHCERVPVIAQLLLNEANKSTSDTFKDFSLTSKDALREFEIGAWLHDCGKVTTPEYIVDKSTKLEVIYNRIHEIRMRFEVLWRDIQIEYLNKDISLEVLHKKQAQLHDDFAFIASCNIGGEFMDAENQIRIRKIADIKWQRHFDNRLGLSPIEFRRYPNKDDEIYPVTEMLLSDKKEHILPRENFDYEAYAADKFKLDVPEHLYNYGEIYNLCIERGTLSQEERYKINEHIIMSIKMLEKIPFPPHLSNVTEYAGTHHETLIGTGYPRRLCKDDLSIPARIMAIADIFEALTASDRPYKKANTLSESIKIMSSMVGNQHIDPDLFKLFLSSGVYKTYAKKYLPAEQIDEVDIETYL